MVAHFHLYPQVLMHPDYDQQPYQGDCDNSPYCLHYPNPHVVGGDEVDGEDNEDSEGDNDSVDMDSPSPNNKGNSSPNSTTVTNHSDKAYSNNRMDRSSRNTNYTKALPQPPTSQTSRLYT